MKLTKSRLKQLIRESYYGGKWWSDEELNPRSRRLRNMSREAVAAVEPRDIRGMNTLEFDAFTERIKDGGLYDTMSKETARAYDSRWRNRNYDIERAKATTHPPKPSEEEPSEEKPSPAEEEEDFSSPLLRYHQELAKKYRLGEVKRIIREEIEKEIRESKLR